jgi:hypothetical protein
MRQQNRGMPCEEPSTTRQQGARQAEARGRAVLVCQRAEARRRRALALVPSALSVLATLSVVGSCADAPRGVSTFLHGGAAPHTWRRAPRLRGGGEGGEVLGGAKQSLLERRKALLQKVSGELGGAAQGRHADIKHAGDASAEDSDRSDAEQAGIAEPDRWDSGSSWHHLAPPEPGAWG